MIAFLSTQELIIIFVIVFVLFGAKKLPELARGIGKSLGEFKKAKSEFENELLNAEKPATPVTPPAAVIPADETVKKPESDTPEQSEAKSPEEGGK